MRLILLYILTLSFGGLVAFGIAKLIGIWFPKAMAPVFILLSVWWMFTGWQHAKRISGQR